MTTQPKTPIRYYIQYIDERCYGKGGTWASGGCRTKFKRINKERIMDKPEKKELHGKESTEIDLIGHQYALETLVRNLGLKEGSNYSDILENVIPKSSVGEIVDVYERWNGIIYSIGQGRGTTDKSDYTWDMWKAIKTCAERCK